MLKIEVFTFTGAPIYVYVSLLIFISRRALAWEGDYEMMPVCACVRACVTGSQTRAKIMVASRTSNF